MSSVRRHPVHSEWLDGMALASSRRYARVTLALLLACIALPCLTARAPRLHLSAAPSCAVTLRFHSPVQEPAPLPEKTRRLLASEPSFVIPEAERARQTPTEPFRTAPAKKQPLRPREREKARPLRHLQPVPVAPLPVAAQEVSVPTAGPAPSSGAQLTAASRQMALRILMEAIERRKHYPKQARRIGAQGTVTLLVRIGADGNVQECTVSQGCGISTLDLETARLGTQLEGLATGVRGEAFSVKVPVRYALH